MVRQLTAGPPVSQFASPIDGARHAPLRWRRARRLVVRLLAVPLLGLTGCYYVVTTDPLPQAERSADAPVGPQAYVLQIGDQIGVRFYQNPDLDEDLIIRPDGKISLQLIGDVQAAGIGPQGLATEIERAYAAELAQPRVVVLVRALGARVYVGGEVGSPGVVPYFADLTLLQAIQQAGGLLVTAHLKQVVLIRRGADGKLVGRVVDMRDIIGGSEPGQDVPLKPFDVAFVPRSKIADLNLFMQQYVRDLLPINPGTLLFQAF